MTYNRTSNPVVRGSNPLGRATNPVENQLREPTEVAAETQPWPGVATIQLQSVGHPQTVDSSARRRLYFVWRKMVLRCTDPSDSAFGCYGARGITVAVQWRDFNAFLSSMPSGYAQGLQLDRIDNDGPYSPSNCRWSTRRENQANTRKTRLIEAFGQKLPLREWSRRTGIHIRSIQRSLNRGDAPEIALGGRS